MRFTIITLVLLIAFNLGGFTQTKSPYKFNLIDFSIEFNLLIEQDSIYQDSIMVTVNLNCLLDSVFINYSPNVSFQHFNQNCLSITMGAPDYIEYNSKFIKLEKGENCSVQKRLIKKRIESLDFQLSWINCIDFENYFKGTEFYSYKEQSGEYLMNPTLAFYGGHFNYIQFPVIIDFE